MPPKIVCKFILGGIFLTGMGGIGLNNTSEGSENPKNEKPLKAGDVVSRTGSDSMNDSGMGTVESSLSGSTSRGFNTETHTDSHKGEIERLATSLSWARRNVITEENRQKRVARELLNINRKMKKIVSDRSELVRDQVVASTQAKDLAQKIEKLETQIKIQKGLLRDRLLALYKMGGHGIARLIFSASSAGDLDRNLHILGVIATQDLDLIRDYSRMAKELETKRKRLNLRLNRLKKIELRILAKENRLSEENSAKVQLLNQIRQSRDFNLSQISHLKEQSKTISKSLSDLQDSGVYDLLFRPSLFDQRGNLAPPVTGSIAIHFGVVKDETYNVALGYNGIFLETHPETPVRAVLSGRVAFAGMANWAGPTVILDHGDHYYTVYGTNDSLNVKEGDEVQTGQVVALSGTSQWNQKNGSYFEIRHFGEPYDPEPWFKRKVSP